MRSKPAELTAFYRMAHRRGVTTKTIARQIGSGRAYVSRVISGHERRGPTWKRIRRILTPNEIELLEAIPEREPQKTILRA